MRISSLILLWLATTAPLMADSPAIPMARVFSSDSNVFFAMVPARYAENSKIKREAFGIAYRLYDDGQLNELYRTEGWYSFNVFISQDGRYLVRMGPWSSGSEPEPDDLAVAFYIDGKLLKQYSTADLVKDKSKVVASVSHYFWQAPSPNDDEVSEASRFKLRLYIDFSNLFRIHTIDGWTYTFDITTGEIRSAERTSS